MRRWASFALIGLSAMLACGLAVAGAGAQEGPLTLEERTASSLGVAWNWDERPAAAFEVAWRPRGEDDAASWRSVRKSASERRHVITGLEAGVHYIVRVRALDAAGLPLSDLRRVFATAESAPLTLDLQSSRELCTAGTLTEVSWTISGGVAPYTLSIEGEAVDVDADNVRVNCGALTETEAGASDVALTAKRITATVTDSRGTHRQAAIDVARARALPALPPASGESVWAHRGELGFKWLAPATPYACRKPSCFAIRWRAVGAEAWAHASLTLNLSEQNLAIGIVRGLADGVVYEAAAAAMRDPIELETPEALHWTAPLSGTTLTNPTGLTATATHDTVTVRWDRQPTARFWSVQLRGPDGALGRNVQSWDAASWGDPASSVHEVVFRDVPSSTDYEVGVDWNVMEGYEGTSAETSVRTLPLPAGREPLPRGPQNLCATSTHNSITVTWDRPFSGDSSDYVVYLFETDYSLLLRLEFVYPPASQITLSDLESETEYRVVVMHNSIVRAEDEIEVTTPAPPVQGANETTATTRASGRSESVMPIATPKPLFEWWADGRPASPPLNLKLESSRDLCTAGTLTEISWTISGGVAPYQLSIEGAAVDVDADNIRINCGALTEAEAGDAEAALAAKTVSAVVTDSRGVQRTATLDVARARALPAPTGLGYSAHVGHAWTFWNWVEGAGSQSPERSQYPGGGGDLVRDKYLVRYRASGDTVWRHTVWATNSGLNEWETAGPGIHEMQVAAIRHSIETETPPALRWSETLRYVYATAPDNVAVTTTATTVTVSWDAQPLTGDGEITLEGPRGRRSKWFIEPNEADRHSYTFPNVPPETSYEVTIDKSTPSSSVRGWTSLTARTKEAPAGWNANPAGPQNVTISLTGDEITVTWDEPYPDAPNRYDMEIKEEATGALVDVAWITGASERRTWSTRGVFRPIQGGTTYRVRVTHVDLITATVHKTVTVPMSMPSGAEDARSKEPSVPPIEWWADGRPASPPLHLELQSSRKLCTAGTLTEISWTISGGVAPYELSVEGAVVDVDAENVRINCGALTEAEAGDAEAALAAKTVSAVVTDSRGVQRQATLDVARGRALPAPSPRGTVVQQTSMATNWATIGGAHHGASIGWWLMRWHPAPDSGANWTYVLIKQPRVGDIVIGGFGGLREGSSYAYAVATLRDPIEQMTPDALVWSGELEATTSTTPTDVQATSTHDTITVTWDEQPSVRYVYVEFIRADGVGRYGSATMRRWDATLTDQVTLIDLEPETEYDITVSVDGDVEARLSTAIKATTTAAPTGWRAPPRGAQNLSVTATHDTITVTWDAPVPNTRDRWIVYVSHPSWTKSYARWVSAPLTATLGPFTPETTYSVTVAHLDHHGTDVTTTVTTADAPRHGHYDQPPLIEWWADGRPTSPPLHLELRSSRELCTAGTLTEVSWTISGGVAPYTLSIEGEAVDADADNIRINCGPLPTDPHTGELLAAQPKTFHASVSDSRGVATAASVAVTLTTPPYLAADTALRYETYDSTGGAATSGSYAFLADGAAGAVATYEGLRDGSATQLLIHKTDAQGTSRATLYDAVAAGDLFERRQSYDCWVRYRVTEVRPDPPGAAPRKQLAVERTSYAFSGCTGAIAADAAVLLAWGALPDLGGPTLAAPLRHGPFQIVPEGWAGPVEDDPFRPWPGNSYANPASTTELAEARQLPHWRDPTLPAGWTLSRASSGDPHLDPPYGYCSWWATDRGYGGVELCGGFSPAQDRPRESSESSGVVVVETRMIAGRPAIVEYSPAGPNHNPYVAVRVLVSDPILDVVYHVRGLDGTLRGDRFDAGIAIARSLFEESN